MFSVRAAFPSHPGAAAQQVTVRRGSVQPAGAYRAVIHGRGSAFVRSLARAAQGRQSDTGLLAQARLSRATRHGRICSGRDAHVTVVALHVDQLRNASHTARMAEPNWSFNADAPHIARRARSAPRIHARVTRRAAARRLTLR
jgi:hypothetical protein